MWRHLRLASGFAFFAGTLACGHRPPPGPDAGWSGAIRESALLTDERLLNSDPDALFSSDSPLSFRLEADFSMLLDDREQESEERPGRLILKTGSEETSIPVKVRTRGNFRLRDYICPFPPLRLNFPEDSLKGTVLEGQDKLKLVTHCRDRDDYEQNVLEEYLAYRIYGLLTDLGFRVQLALIDYRDTSGKEDPVSRLGFFIEDEDIMATRLGGEFLEVPAANPDDFHPQQAGLMYLFEYLIGNTDWSLVRFHNVKLLRVDWDYFPIPYDFDFSGLVDAPYAGPPTHLAERISSVTERLYRGICSSEIDYPALFQLFLEKKPAIMEAIADQPGLTTRNRREAVVFVEEFFETLEDEHDRDWRIVNACRRRPNDGS